MNVDDVIAERIEAARRRADEAKQRRMAFRAARQVGLTARHRAKLARLIAAERTDPPTETDGDTEKENQ